MNYLLTYLQYKIILSYTSGILLYLVHDFVLDFLLLLHV